MPKDCLALVFRRAGAWSPSNKKRTRLGFCWRWWRSGHATPTGHRDKAMLPSGGSSSLKVQNFRYGRLNVLRWLLWEAEMPALERSSNGALALHYAAARGCLDCVKLLVESSTELSANTQMDNDVTPVYLAAQEGHLEVLKFLVTEAGGSLYVRAKDGMAPVHAASQMGCLSCLKWMVQEQGVDPNLRDGDGATPLHFAASRGHAETVRWLLRHGARLVLDKFGKSPINDAAENQQMECLNILVQHGATPDYPEARHKPTGCSCCKGESQGKCTEPFFLHPPPTQHQQPDGLYVNPAHGSTSDPFYLHNPRDVVYNRVKDLFESPNGSQPPAPTLSGLKVKVELHSSSSGAGSDENLSSSDLSEHSADPENDYEEIYQSREEKTTASGVRRRSRDSGSHSRSSSSSNIHVVVTAPPAAMNDAPAQEEPSMTASTDLEPMLMLDSIIRSYEEEQESGVSSGSPSDLGHSEEECEKTRVSHRHSLPHLQHSAGSNRALKRVVSEPGPMCPPPPPPPPPAEEGLSSPSRSPSPPEPEVVEEPTVKPSEVVQREETVADQPFLLQKEDLIAELKMSKDITGIKKLKVERAKVEEQQEKELFSEITRQLTANSFVEKIPEKDATGNPIPAWKRQMMAKKAAERARKELEEQMLKEAEEKRLQAIPPWKRQLLAKKEEHDGKKTNLYTPRVMDDKKTKPSKPEEVLRQQLPSNSEVTPAVEDGNKENKTPEQQEVTSLENNDEPEQIIPWRAQLRKTNSKLSLLE
ncbi:espin isoform X1 [Zootermopsis nevadensis]|uniref:espin isoform X1 n=2 Tax=Zootermopsis nevadensis TaxID=136037 RepID=UPI000B8ED03A|nr:espin isoform X1 [Zootermopsis nevadensis]